MLVNLYWKYDVLMVGGWSYRKGCDLIIEALRASNLRFLHIGGIVDIEFPSLPNFTHKDAVDQRILVEYYQKAKIALLPSREEGLAMVQAQAIACNLPLVGSEDSGAEDLKKMVEFPEYVTIIKDFTPSSVLDAINIALRHQKAMKCLFYAGNVINNLTWEAYGKRYSNFINDVIVNK